MKPVLSPSEIAQSDHYTIHDLGIEGIELMARAGKACIGALLHESGLASLKKQGVLALAGTGNNGGDAFVMAEILRNMQVPVELLVFGIDETRLKPDAKYFFDLYKKNGGTFRFSKEKLTIPLGVLWILDGLLGTGLSGPPKGMLGQWVTAVNQSNAKVFAIDIPSGNYPGCDLQTSVSADLCVTFQALKPAHVIAPGCFHCGKTYIADIGIKVPKHIKAHISLLEASDCVTNPRNENAHKGSFGTLAILGGARGMEGAAALAGLASLRSGSGKTRIYSQNPNSPKFFHACLMVGSWEGDLNKEPYKAWVIGPGLSHSPQAAKLIKDLNFGTTRTLWDADGLLYFQEKFDSLQPETWVITPHPGEAAMLLGTQSSVIQADRRKSLLKLGVKFPGGWIILKGARTMILDPKGQIYVSLPGNSALAVAGSGDVLAGIIGGTLAQHHGVEDAVLQGVLKHGLTSENWVVNHLDCAMLPEDMIEELIYAPASNPCIKSLSVPEGNSTLYEANSDLYFS